MVGVLDGQVVHERLVVGDRLDARNGIPDLAVACICLLRKFGEAGKVFGDARLGTPPAIQAALHKACVDAQFRRDLSNRDAVDLV
jgi:hypothetical protein